MDWELLRFLHLLGIAFFVGGQLMLAIVVTPALRGQDAALMRGAARRTRAISYAVLATSLVIFWLGVALAH